MTEHPNAGTVSAKEAARLLGVKRPTVYAYVRQGKLRAHRPTVRSLSYHGRIWRAGKHVRIYLESVRQMLSERTQ